MKIRFFCLLFGSLKGQFKLTSVPVRAFNITLVKDHCIKTLGLTLNGMCVGEVLLSRRNKASFDTSFLGIHGVLQKHCLPSSRSLKSPTREFAVSQESGDKLLPSRYKQRHPRLALAACHLCLVCHVYLDCSF